MSDVLLTAMRLTACDDAAAAHICNGTLVCGEKMHIFTCNMRLRSFAHTLLWTPTLAAGCRLARHVASIFSANGVHVSFLQTTYVLYICTFRFFVFSFRFFAFTLFLKLN